MKNRLVGFRRPCDVLPLTNMFALGLAAFLFLFFAVVGRAVQSAANLKFGALRSWLLSPGIGVAVVVLALMAGNQGGIPIGSLAWLVTIGLAVVSAAILAWRRPAVPWRALAPFLAAAAFFLLWAAWPMLKYGFHWISFVNDDYVNYCLAAERFKEFGFYRIPTVAELSGKDYSQYYWFMHALNMMRFGSEHVVAWTSSLAGVPALQGFMPAIIGLGMAQIFAGAALALHRGRRRRLAIIAAFLLSFSPMYLFGCLYQLFAQVGGMCLLITGVALLTARLTTRRRLRVFAYAVPAALVGAALCVFYPEVTPFAGIAAGFFLVLEWWNTGEFPGARVVLFLYSLVGVLLLLRYNLIGYIYTLSNQYVGGTKHVDLSLSLFPFFLIPSGLPSLFGFQPMNLDVPEPLGSILVAAGLVLLVAAFVAALRGARRASPSDCLLLVMFAVGVVLYRSGNDFGLYKLVMFLQAPLAAALAAVFIALPWRRWAPRAAVAAMFAATAHTALVYTRSSASDDRGVTEEVRHSSEFFTGIPPRPPPGAHWSSAIDNVSAAKLAASFYRGSDLWFLSRDYFFQVILLQGSWPLMSGNPHRDVYAFGDAFQDYRSRALFPERHIFGTAFNQTVEPEKPDAYLDLSSDLSLFNKLHPDRSDSGRLFTLVPASRARNLLVFVHSDKGNQYYLGDRRKISFYQQEFDNYDPGHGFNAIGRFMLLRVVNPTDPFYLRLLATKTVMGGGRTTWSPEADVLARKDVALELVGGGAANRIVGPISPVWLDGAAYIAIDFKQPATAFPYRRTALKALYNANVNLDYRRVLAFARDISALSPAEKDALVRPRSITRFPEDLVGAAGLEYSGIYEDGWLSPDAEFVLGSAAPGEELRIAGYVPELPGTPAQGRLEVSVNGGPEFGFSSAPGLFNWIVPIEHPGPETRLRMRFTASGNLPEGDDRPVGAKLTSLSIERPASGRVDFSTSLSARPPCEGIDQDGWTAQVASLSLPVAPSDRALKVVISYPGWQGLPPVNAIRISVDGGPASSHALIPGDNSITLPIEPGSTLRNLRLEAEKTFRIPWPDGRVRAYRIMSAEAVSP